MKFRKYGKIDFKVSALGFGCMRLPTTDNRAMSQNIDVRESGKMIEYAIENGINYFDTAYPYHEGKSEIFLGNFFKNGLRAKIKLATKSPVWFINSKDDFTKYLHEQLEKLQTNYIDYYLLHSLDKSRWNNAILKFDVLEAAEKAKKEGLIKHLGFSFHDDFASFKEIIDGYKNWEFCQIQYNYMDIENQAGTKGLNYAAGKGLGIAIMEPLLGGRLANPPKNIGDILKSDKNLTPAEWALKWVWNHDQASTVLSGFNTFSQLKQNIESVERLSESSMTDEEIEIINKARIAYKEKIKINCTKCNYCQPCPNDVNIPRNFELYNDIFIHENSIPPRISYQKYMLNKEKASNCIQCGECEDKCPQKINISGLMSKIDLELSKNL